MSSPSLQIEIKTVADLRAAKEVERSLQQQIMAAKAAGTAYVQLEQQLSAVQGAIAKKGFVGRAGSELLGMAEGIPVIGSLMRSMNGGVGILSAGLVGLTAAAGAARAALASFSRIEDLQTSFVTLLGSVDAAKGRMAELQKFANATPFDLVSVARASRVLQNLTDGALATSAGLRLVGDVAAATNTPFEEIAVTVGRLYQGLKNGTPVGEAAARISELTGINVRNAKSWEDVEHALSKYNGEMERMSGTLTGKESTLGDAWNTFLAALGKPVAPAYKGFLETLTVALDAWTKVVSMEPKTPKMPEGDGQVLVGRTAEEDRQAVDIESRRKALRSSLKFFQEDSGAAFRDLELSLDKYGTKLVPGGERKRREALQARIDANDGNIAAASAALRDLDERAKGMRSVSKEEAAKIRPNFQNTTQYGPAADPEAVAAAAAAADQRRERQKAGADTASLAEAEAAGNTKEVANLKWLQRVQSLMDSGVTEWDARRIANAEAFKKPEKPEVDTRPTPESIARGAVGVSSLARIGAAMGESAGGAPVVERLTRMIEHQRRTEEAAKKTAEHMLKLVNKRNTWQ